MVRTLRLLPLLLLPLSAGCIPQVQHSPNPNFLAEIGLEQGQLLLGEILTRVRQPRIFNVEVAPEWFIFETSGYQVQWGWYGHTVGNRIQIFFTNIRNIDYYENDRMMLYDLAGRRIAQFDVLSRHDGIQFLDLVAGFQNLGGQWPGPANPSPPPPEPEPYPEESTREPLLEDTPPPPVEPEPTYRDERPTDEEGNTRSLLDED